MVEYAHNKALNLEMDYIIRQHKSELDSTGYIEIGPGKYSGKHWQEGFIFIWEDAFGMAEGIIIKNFPDYDHFGMNDIPKKIGERIIEDWRTVAKQLITLSPKQTHSALNLDAVYHSFPGDEIAANRHKIQSMLAQLSEHCSAFYNQNEWICILGV